MPRRKEEPSTASKQSLRADEAAYLQYIERSLDRKMEGSSSHSNREEKEDLELLSRRALTIQPWFDPEWKALQEAIPAILTRKGATSGERGSARLDRILSKIDDWEEKNFGKNKFLSHRTHLELLKVYWFVKKLQRALLGDVSPEESLQNLACEAWRLKSESWFFKNTLTEIKEALEKYKCYKQIGGDSDVCAIRQQLKQLTSQWLVHAQTQEKVIVSHELRRLVALRRDRQASASQDLIPATSPGDLQANKEEFEETIGRIGNLPTSDLGEAIQKVAAKIQRTLSLGQKAKLIKVEASLMEQWLEEHKKQLGVGIWRTDQQLLNMYLFVKILQRALNEGQVDLSSYAGIAQNLDVGLLQRGFGKIGEIQAMLKKYQSYREKGEEGEANKKREKLNGLLTKWVKSNKHKKIIVVHDLLDLEEQEIARLKEERAKAPVRETLAWGVDTMREGLRRAVNVAFDSVIIPISQWAAIYATSRAVGRWLPITRHIPYINTAIGATVTLPFRWFIKKPIELVMKIPRDRLSKRIDEGTRSIFTMFSGALNTVSHVTDRAFNLFKNPLGTVRNVAGKIRQMFNPWGGRQQGGQSVSIGDVEQGSVQGKEVPKKEAPKQEMTEQDFVARAKLEDVAFCDPYSNEREVFYDAEPVSDEEYEECDGTPAADKEGKAVTPS
ncbi:MAG: hypothetical protein MI674_02925, partial [Cytophagales bacterium]|nr:hypothetical protein [Cytophagales bacterium]